MGFGTDLDLEDNDLRGIAQVVGGKTLVETSERPISTKLLLILILFVSLVTCGKISLHYTC